MVEIRNHPTLELSKYSVSLTKTLLLASLLMRRNRPNKSLASSSAPRDLIRMMKVVIRIEEIIDLAKNAVIREELLTPTLTEITKE